MVLTFFANVANESMTPIHQRCASAFNSRLNRFKKQVA
jgi:hypothetical protein